MNRMTPDCAPDLKRTPYPMHLNAASSAK